MYRFHQSTTGRLTKNTEYILCNRSISLTDFDVQLVGFILHKGLSTNSGHYLSMVKFCEIWFECDDVKIIKIEFNHFCKSNTVYVILQKKHMMEMFKGHCACPNGCCLFKEFEEKAPKLHTQQVPPEDLLPCIAYFQFLLLPFLFFGLCLLLLLVSLDIDPILFVLDLHMKYTVEVVPLCTYIVWFVIMW